MAFKSKYIAPTAEVFELTNGLSILSNASPLGDLYGDFDGFDHDPNGNAIYGDNYIRD